MSPGSFKRFLANALTLSRFFAAALVWAGLATPLRFGEAAALAAFTIGSMTDYWDGRLARQAGGYSAFGRVMDPLADKALTIAAFAGLAARSLIAPWLVWLIVARDVIVTWQRFRVAASTERSGARKSGKWKTFLQMAFLVAVLAHLTLHDGAVGPAMRAFLDWGSAAIAALTVWSGVLFLAARPSRA